MADEHADEQSEGQDTPLRRFIDPDFLDFYGQIEVTRRDAVDRAADLPTYSAAAVLALLQRPRELAKARQPESEPTGAGANRTEESEPVDPATSFGTAEPPTDSTSAPADLPTANTTIESPVDWPPSIADPRRQPHAVSRETVANAPNSPVSPLSPVANPFEVSESRVPAIEESPALSVELPPWSPAARTNDEPFSRTRATDPQPAGIPHERGDAPDSGELARAGGESHVSRATASDDRDDVRLSLADDLRPTAVDAVDDRPHAPALAAEPKDEDSRGETDVGGSEVRESTAAIPVPAGPPDESPPRATIVGDLDGFLESSPDLVPTIQASRQPGPGPQLPSELNAPRTPAPASDRRENAPAAASTDAGGGPSSFESNEPLSTPVELVQGLSDRDRTSAEAGRAAFLLELAEQVELSIGAESPAPHVPTAASVEPRRGMAQDNQPGTHLETNRSIETPPPGEADSKPPPVWEFALEADAAAPERPAPPPPSSTPTFDLGSAEEQRASLERRRERIRDERSLPGIVFPPGPADLPPPPPRREPPGIEFPPGPADLRPPPPKRLPGIEFPPGPAAAVPAQPRPSVPTIDLTPTRDAPKHPSPAPVNPPNRDERPVVRGGDQRPTAPITPPRVNRPRPSRAPRNGAPARRRDRRPEILARLNSGPASAQELASDFEISREGVLRWLRQLEADGTIRSTAQARTSRVNKWVLVEQPLVEPQSDA